MKRLGRAILLTALLAICASTGAWPAEGPGKSPLLAMVASTVIPGGGQFYCENYLRGTLFLCAQTTLTAMTLYEHVLTEEALRRYNITGDDQDYADYSHHFDRRKDLLWWDAGILVFAAADAFVNAHMYDFGKRGGVKVGMLPGEGPGVHVRVWF
jgi:hypothetical protein